MIKKHIPQIIVGLFVTIVGGVLVSYLTTWTSDFNNNEDVNVKTKIIKTNNYSNLNFKITGSSNMIYLSQGKTALDIKDITVTGSSEKISYTIPPNYKVYLNVSGASNMIDISSKLHDFVFVNNTGASNHIK